MAPNVKVLLKILNILLLRHVSEATEPINWIYISCNGKNLILGTNFSDRKHSERNKFVPRGIAVVVFSL